MAKSMRKDTLENMQSIAALRGGQCLSTQYTNAHTHVEWRCSEGHRWKALPSNVKRGQWCPTCSKRNRPSEEKCRIILERLTGNKFPKYHLTKENLELDGFCSELNIAFEYQGRQHYAYSPFFHGSHMRFRSQQERDRRKKQICYDSGIYYALDSGEYEDESQAVIFEVDVQGLNQSLLEIDPGEEEYNCQCEEGFAGGEQ